MASKSDELLNIFIEEATDLVVSISATLSSWEKDLNNKSILTDLIRDLHTLKGSARMVGQSVIGTFAHELESLSVSIQQNKLSVDSNLLLSIKQNVDKITLAIEGLRKKESKDVKGLGDEIVRIRASLLEKLNNLSTENAMLRVGLEQNVNNMGTHIHSIKQELRRLELQVVNLAAELQTYSILTQHYDISEDPRKKVEFERYNNLEQMNNILRETTYDIANIIKVLVESHAETETTLLNQARIGTELQHRLAETRLVPFESIVPRLNQISRQMMQELNKEVNFKVLKTEGEMDRLVLEQLIPSLEHILRNAIDHGIESKEERKKLHKPEIGTIELSFSRSGSLTVIEICDDGKGINIQSVRNKAIKNGRIEPDTALSDDEIMRLILEPGFSTREAVTQISGRGVGMDVVNTTVNELGGNIIIESVEGKGTKFVIRFPFTASLNRVLMFNLHNHIYGVQLTSIDTVVLIEFESIKEMMNAEKPVFKHGEKTYQLHYLAALLSEEKKEFQIRKRKSIPLILFSAPDYSMALIVDSILYSREVVVQTLGAQFKLTNECSGGTLLGDGRVVFILDLYNLSRKAIANSERGKVEIEFLKEKTTAKTEKAIIMVVDDSVSVRTVTKKLLERYSYQVITAKDGLDALQQVEMQMPDLILLDLDMPRMDGIEFATHLRRDERFQNIPIIIISSKMISVESPHMQELKINHYIRKPYQETELLSAVQALLGKNS